MAACLHRIWTPGLRPPLRRGQVTFLTPFLEKFLFSRKIFQSGFPLASPTLAHPRVRTEKAWCTWAQVFWSSFGGVSTSEICESPGGNLRGEAGINIAARWRRTEPAEKDRELRLLLHARLGSGSPLEGACWGLLGFGSKGNGLGVWLCRGSLRTQVGPARA